MIILNNLLEQDGFETTTKKAIQKTAEATGDWIGIKTANKITSVPGTSALQHWWNRKYMIW